MLKSDSRTMSYFSSLSNAEWEILEPLLVEILPQKKRTRPTNWSQRELLDGIFYQLKNGCNWQDLPKDLPPYSTVYWHYKQWREAGAIASATVRYLGVNFTATIEPEVQKCVVDPHPLPKVAGYKYRLYHCL